jgi:hypothetical protein
MFYHSGFPLISLSHSDSGRPAYQDQHSVSRRSPPSATHSPLMQSPLLSLLRPLGNLERWSAIRHTLGYHNSVTLAIALSPAAADSLTPENVYAALNNCLAAHAVLSVTIINDPHFARIPRLELSEVVTFCDVTPDLEGPLGGEASRGFGNSGAGIYVGG